MFPWNGLNLVDSTYREPKAEIRARLLSGFKEIYASWKTTLESQLNEEYYLALWMYEQRISRSEIVCAIGDKIDYYENLFVDNSKAISRHNPFVQHFNSELVWTPKIDEDEYVESLLDWQGDYKFESQRLQDQRLLRKLRNGSYRSFNFEHADGDKDRVFFVPVGTIWIGK